MHPPRQILPLWKYDGNVDDSNKWKFVNKLREKLRTRTTRFLSDTTVSVSSTEHHNGPFPPDGSQLIFEKVMAHPEGVNEMLAFARSEYSDENILFWSAATNWKTDCAGLHGAIKDASLLERAVQIIDTYLCESAESLVNLPSGLQTHFKLPARKGRYEIVPSIFDAPLADMFKLIRVNTFSRFRRGPAAAALAAAQPLLAVEDAAEEEVQAEEAPARIQKALKRMGAEWKELTAAQRAELLRPTLPGPKPLECP